ncbi:MAG: alpha-glucosidase [Streptococcaceae bacterium]|nr:alpha-glucosidase [Streptococcaceae bacterium]
MKTTEFHKWVGYQIYPKSFKDSNGDGIGDLRGVIEKLPYLKSLGVDVLWLNPVYASPQVDGGYDISDFCAIDPMFGTMADFKELLEKVHALGMKLIMDLVVNHTSDQHPWFIEAQKSRDNKYRDYYLWADATEDALPNNWRSFFGIPAWTYQAATKQAYFHVFASQQPDLNWKNPALREEIYAMIRWWLTLGIDGFRLDAISHIQKAPWDFKITSLKGNGPWQPFMNVAGIEHYLSDLRAIFEANGAFTVGEASGVTSDKASAWTDDDGYMDAIFELEHRVIAPNGHASISGYKKVIMRWQQDLQAGGGWNALYLENHDGPRSIDLYGDGTVASAKALAVSFMLLRGTPFIYQGQELGMPNFPFQTIEETTAPENQAAYEKLILSGLTEKEALDKVTKNSRDHSRTPMKWPDDTFTTADRPWMVELQDFTAKLELTELYRALIALRHDEPAISDGAIDFLFTTHPQVLAYTRDDFLILTNLSTKKAHLSFPPNMVKYKQVLGSTRRQLTENMTLDAWSYHVFQRADS